MYFSSIKFFPVWLALGTTLTTSQLHASDLPSFSSNSCTSSKVIPIVEAFSHDDHDRYYRPSRVIDNNLLNYSRWSSKGIGRSIIFDLGYAQNINNLHTAWYKGHKRKAYFDVATSTDGSRWDYVLTNATASGTKDYIAFDLKPSKAQFVKIIGKGSSDSSWNSLTEVKVTGCVDEKKPVTSCRAMDNLAIRSASSPHSYDADYSPSRAIDNNLDMGSRWSSKGLERSIILELEGNSTIRKISTAWYRGNQRKAFFDVFSSSDKKSWKPILTRAVAEAAQGMIDFDVKESEAKYVKIIGYGNSTSLWNSIIEVDIFGCGEKYVIEPKVDNSESIALIQSLFDLEGGDDILNPYRNDNSLVFDALKSQHVTENGHGWRHELKMAKDNRKDMYNTSESFSAQITPSLSSGAKTIALQYHGGDTGTLVKLYVSDTNESKHDDSSANNGIFDVYARLRTHQSKSETVVNFGTIRSGESFDFKIVNKRGDVTVSAMGTTQQMKVANSDGSYLKFGNYLQAQDAETGKDVKSSKDWANFYKKAGITKSVITFSNVNYTRG